MAAHIGYGSGFLASLLCRDLRRTPNKRAAAEMLPPVARNVCWMRLERRDEQHARVLADLEIDDGEIELRRARGLERIEEGRAIKDCTS